MVVMVQELVYYEEGGPVRPVSVDEDREGPEPDAGGGVGVAVVQRGEYEHEDDLSDAEEDLGEGGGEGGQTSEPRLALHREQLLLVTARSGSGHHGCFNFDLISVTFDPPLIHCTKETSQQHHWL